MPNNVRFLDNVSVGSYGDSTNTGSVNYALSSSYAQTASYAEYAVSASHEIIKEESSSFADTASFAQSGNGPFTGSFTGSFFGNGNGIFSGSFTGVKNADTASYVNPLQQNVNVTGDIEATGVISASKFTANSGSTALLPGYTFHHDSGTGLYSANAGDLQFQLAGGGTPEITLSTGQATFRVPIQLNNNELINPSRIRGLGSISASGDISSSITSTASFGTYLGDGSQLTGVDGFPFTGSALITGSLEVTGSIDVQSGSITIGYPQALNWKGANGQIYNKIDSNSDPGTGYYALQYFSNGGDGDANIMHQFYTNKGAVNNTSVVEINRGGDLNVTGSVISKGASSNLSGSFSGSFQGNGSNLTGITSKAGTTANRVAFTTAGGELTTEAGFEYNPTTNQLTVDSINAISFTSSFITSSTIQSSGSHVFGDDTNDTQTLVGTVLMSGSAEVTGSLSVKDGNLNLTTSPTSPGINTHVNLGAGSTTTTKALKIQTNAGYLEIGPQNASYSHFYTDRANFYFNQPIHVNGAIYGYGGDLILGRNSGTEDTITLADERITFELNNTDIFIMSSSHEFSGSAISTASFGTYLGDGSQLTGIEAGTNLTQSIFVTQNGDDTTGTIGNMSKPFATLNSASQAATTGSTIFVYPGTYTAEAENLAFEGGSYYFYPGTVVSKSAAGDVFNITDFNVGFNVYGHADFYLTSSAESLYEGGTNGNEILFNTTFECQDITSDTGTDYLFRDAHKSSVISIKAREITTDEGGFFQYTGAYSDYPEIKIDIDRAYLGERFISSPAGYLNVNANYVRSTNNSAISQFYYIAAGTFNIGYCQGNSYAYDIGNATQNQHIVINGYANAINISGNHDVQHNGHCYDLTISAGRYVGNSVGKFTMSGGEADIIYNQQADSSNQNQISVSGGAAQIELLSKQNSYFAPISISGGQVILTGGYYGYSSNYSVTVSGGELIYKAHIDYSINSSTNKNPITLTGGLLRMQGYVKNQLTDSDSTPQQSTCIKKTGGTLILDGATLIVSSSVAPPIWAPNQSEEVKIYAGGVNTNRTGSMGLLEASSSFGSGGYALTNPLGGMIIEDSSVE
jgi:hypothetical protein